MSKKIRLEVLISIRPLPVWIMVSQWPAFQNNKIHSWWPQPEIINAIKKYEEETFSPQKLKVFQNVPRVVISKFFSPNTEFYPLSILTRLKMFVYHFK